MQYIEILALIGFFACAAVLGLGMILDHLLFRSLEKKYPAYYKSIGEPLVLVPFNLTSYVYTRLMKGSSFGYSMVFKGTPKNFPKDKHLIKLVQGIRIVFMIFPILALALVALIFFLYQSGAIQLSNEAKYRPPR